MKKISCLLLIALASTLGSAPASAVTQQEMEQARTTAAKMYLRYANNMSAYLDDLHPKTMAELEGQLKDTEKANIGAFKAVSVPTDYQQWDKEQLLEYWGGTFFKSPGLDKKGADCYNAVKRELKTMSVTPPGQAPAEQPQAPAAAAPGAESAAPAPALDGQTPDAGQEVASPEAETAKSGKSNTWTYIVLLGILVIIVIGLVVYASNIMRKNNRQQSSSRRRARSEEDFPSARPGNPNAQKEEAERGARPSAVGRSARVETRVDTRAESRVENRRQSLDNARHERDIADRDAEIRRLNSDLSLAKGDLRHTETRLQEANRKLEELRAENRRLRAELERTGAAVAPRREETTARTRVSFHEQPAQAEVYAPGDAPVEKEPKREPRREPRRETIAEPAVVRPAETPAPMPEPAPAPKPAPRPAPKPEPKPESRQEARPAARVVPAEAEPERKENPGSHIYMPNGSKPAAERTIFLGRVNSKGIFVRADRNFNPGNSYYRLVTSDGVSGTFSVINDPSVWETALDAPDDVLFNACTGPKLNETYGRNEIITEEAGTAIFENGAWHVTRKARVRYL